MPGNLNPIPGTEVQKNLPLCFLDFLFNDGHLFLEADAQSMLFRMFFQLLELTLQFGNGLFKVELMSHRL